mmetsp:Transcript_64950/g.168955  ORF Transcript_64950/g.168955 Transcript_64950/m.168955 type:complete len:216 (+) Transcript_64950:1246-1893(+)
MKTTPADNRVGRAILRLRQRLATATSRRQGVEEAAGDPRVLVRPELGPHEALVRGGGPADVAAPLQLEALEGRRAAFRALQEWLQSLDRVLGELLRCLHDIFFDLRLVELLIVVCEVHAVPAEDGGEGVLVILPQLLQVVPGQETLDLPLRHVRGLIIVDQEPQHLVGHRVEVELRSHIQLQGGVHVCLATGDRRCHVRPHVLVVELCAGRRKYP